MGRRARGRRELRKLTVSDLRSGYAERRAVVERARRMDELTLFRLAGVQRHLDRTGL